jgi:ComF family protein
MKAYLTRLLDLIAPRTCAVCGHRLTVTEQSICGVCLLHLPLTRYAFAPLDNLMTQTFWGQLPILRAASLFFYEGHSEVANLIYHLKYHNRPQIGIDMGRILAAKFTLYHFFDDIDVIIPVPLAHRRLRERGYNQSECIAQGISQITGLPIDTHSLERTDFEGSQTQLNRWNRRENVDHLFRLTPRQTLTGKHILLVDDVCTTGATLIACGSAIIHSGDVRISVATLGFVRH